MQDESQLLSDISFLISDYTKKFNRLPQAILLGPKEFKSLLIYNDKEVYMKKLRMENHPEPLARVFGVPIKYKRLPGIDLELTFDEIISGDLDG